MYDIQCNHCVSIYCNITNKRNTYLYEYKLITCNILQPVVYKYIQQANCKYIYSISHIAFILQTAYKYTLLYNIPCISSTSYTICYYYSFSSQFALFFLKHLADLIQVLLRKSIQLTIYSVYECIFIFMYIAYEYNMSV